MEEATRLIIEEIPGLKELWTETLGDPKICIAILDGPVNHLHPSLHTANLTRVDTLVPGIPDQGPATQHGTHIASVIFGEGNTLVKGIAPRCRGLIVPIFKDTPDGSIAPCSQLDLARAITQAVEAGAHVINISGGELSLAGSAHPLMADAVQKCANSNVLIVAAAGNEGCDCLHVPGALPSVLAVGAMNAQGLPLDFSNWGSTYQAQGILAPGENILGANPSGGVNTQSGTSYATPIVSGIAGLLLSLQLKLGRHPNPQAVRATILESAYACDPHVASDCRPFLVGSLNIAGAHSFIAKEYKANVIEPLKENSLIQESKRSKNPPTKNDEHPGLKAGDAAPDFWVKDHTGRSVSLSDYRGRTVVLWFYPQANTPGCIKEGVGFRDRIHEFQALNTQIIGISQDSVEANSAFARKYQFPFPLLSDVAGEVCRAYGALDSSSNRVRRNTYIINPNGVILRVDEDVEPENQAELVLAFLAAVSLRKGEQGKMDDQANELDNGLEHEGMISSSPAATDKQSLGHRQTVMPSQVQPAQSAGLSLVYALGTIGYDLVSEARRDSVTQHMGGNPNAPDKLLAYFKKDPSQAAVIIWTLNLDATPIYAIQPRGAFADMGYQRLQQFLEEQIKTGVERVSIAGTIVGQIQLMSGQVLPVILPELRCMYSWTIAALIKAVCGAPPTKSTSIKEQETYSRKIQAVTNFLERVYHELRNLGLTPQERAINYAATNAMNVGQIFENVLKEDMELDNIEVERSPICRVDSDCWDIKLTFFNPSKVFEQARKVYRFTVDVSDVCPVMVGKVRSWSLR